MLNPAAQPKSVFCKRNPKLSAALCQSAYVVLQQKRFPFVRPESLKEAHTVQKAVIQSGNHGIFRINYLVVESNIIHTGSPALRFRKLRSMVCP
ncbi:hypothetical protein D3C86_1779170 [compost metagenome]